VFAIARKKTVVVVVKCERQMPAEIFVGDKLTAKPGNEGIDEFATARELNLQGFSFGQFIGQSNLFSAHFNSVLCPGGYWQN